MNFRAAVKKLIPKKIFRTIEPYGHLGEAVLFNAMYGFPARELKIIGVTGTDGKTTTCMLIASILKTAGYKVATVTTIAVDYADGAGDQPNPTHLTTPSVSRLLKMFKRIRANKPDWVVLETSSHALAQHRVLGIPYSVAVLTNVSHEHLDYHGTFERYRDAKRRLFNAANRSRGGLRTGIVNADDPSAGLFARDIANTLTYGVKKGEVRAADVKMTPKGGSFVVNFRELFSEKESGQLKITINLPGEFNVYNALAAASVGLALNIEPQQIGKGIEALRSVPGRMMRVDAGQPFEVIIDYAVTPSALENALKSLRQTTKGRVMIVFGATGDRDKAKRPVMGEVAAKNADRIFLTDDETYTEDPASIRQAVFSGIKTAGGAGKCQEIAGRGEAIRQAISQAKSGDAILITGLGHQKDRNMGGKLVPWSDADAAQQILKGVSRG